METVVHTPDPGKKTQPGEPIFLLFDGGKDRRRERRAGVTSLILHAAAVLALALMPPSVTRRVQQVAHSITPLIAPPAELTQPDPNKGPINKEVSAEAILPRPRIQIPPSPPSTTRPAASAPGFSAPRPAPVAPPSLPEPPTVAGGPRMPQIAQAIPVPPQQIQPQEKPKLAFENPAPPPPPGPGRNPGLGRMQTPGSSISEAVRSVSRGGSGGLTVGDIGSGIGGIGEALNMPPSPGRQASNLELLSDPQGVDFRPYLIQVLSMVRRNWFAVMPESARLGRRGKVTIQFSVNRGGNVPKLVIVNPSGTDALDRAAVAGISASNPFPPLPTEFKGELVRLQFNFLYNIPTN